MVKFILPKWPRGSAGHGRAAIRHAGIVLLTVIALATSGCESLLGGAVDPTASTEPATREEIVEVQAILTEKGYAPGPADGMMGPRTTAAIKQYQTDSGIFVNGMATQGLLAHLKQSDMTRAAAALAGSEPDTARIETNRLDSISVPPDYEPGDTYVYSDGVARTVVRVGAERVSWRESTGDTYVTMRAVGLPLLDWESGAWRGRADIERGAIADWPPAEGREIAFDVRSEEWNSADGDTASRLTIDERWACRNDGRRKVLVPAGRFDTVVIACERSPSPAGAWQKRIWYYAPGVRHPLRRDDLDGAGAKLESISLVAAIPGGRDWPPVARAGLQWATQDALSNKAVGEAAEWRSTAVSESFDIRITGESPDAEGKLCRNYILVRKGGGPRRIYPALACRASDGGEWRAPGVSSDFMKFSASLRDSG